MTKKEIGLESPVIYEGSMKDLIKKLNPGIRAKLSFFTAFFVIIIISLVSFLYLQQQYDSLTKSFDREIRPLRLYTEKIVLDLENVSNNFLLVEDFRYRLKTKTKELKQYRRKTVQVVEEKSWFTKNILGQLNIIQQDLIDTEDVTKISLQNTYYSEYITYKKIQEIEESIRSIMRDEKGNIISTDRFRKIQSIAEKANQLIKEIEATGRDIEISLSEKKESEEDLKNLLQVKKNSEIETKVENLKKDLAAKEILKTTTIENLNSEIQSFYYKFQKNNINDLGLNTELIRIQTFNTKDNKIGFDTNIFTGSNALNSEAFINNSLIQRDREERIKNLDIKDLVDMNSDPKEIKIEGKEYEIYFSPILRKPSVVLRAKKILQESRKSKTIWKEFLREDNKISIEIRNIADALRKRLQILRDRKLGKPGLDKEFITLYKDYDSLIKKRKETIEKINLTLESKPKDNSLKESKEDWSFSENLITVDAFQNFREAALYEFGILRFKYNAYSYREFLETQKNRELQTAKFSTIRKWIMDASSETDIPRIILGKETLDPLEGGILSRSRSEMEEEMWRIDSTPLFQLDENETEKGLANELFVSYIAGFTRTIVDKSEGLFKIRQDIRKILYNAGLLGISAIGFAFVLSTVMVKNIRQISKNAQLVGKGNLQIQFDVKSKDEIGMLSSTLNQMVNGLIERDKVKNALGKFVNPQIAEMVLKEELKLGGERKNCAIFFSDIRGFTAISEKLQPEEVVEFLNEYMTEMVRCVNETNGIVDKFIGDAVMATWGAALSKGNDAENAVNGALLMREALLKFNIGRGSGGKPIIQIGCGINYGPVIAGQIGSEERLEYTVIGDAVNLASRVETLNKPFGTDILITSDLYHKVESIFQVERMQAIKVKGKEEPQIIYAVLGRKDNPNCPQNLEELRTKLGIQFDPNKLVNADAKEKKFEMA